MLISPGLILILIRLKILIVRPTLANLTASLLGKVYIFGSGMAIFNRSDLALSLLVFSGNSKSIASPRLSYPTIFKIFTYDFLYHQKKLIKNENKNYI